ncbi:MAG: hypothetical protein WC505_07260 [Patescibacteria group bacterium]
MPFNLGSDIRPFAAISARKAAEARQAEEYQQRQAQLAAELASRVQLQRLAQQAQVQSMEAQAKILSAENKAKAALYEAQQKDAEIRQRKLEEFAKSQGLVPTKATTSGVEYGQPKAEPAMTPYQGESLELKKSQVAVSMREKEAKEKQFVYDQGISSIVSTIAYSPMDFDPSSVPPEEFPDVLKGLRKEGFTPESIRAFGQTRDPGVLVSESQVKRETGAALDLEKLRQSAKRIGISEQQLELAQKKFAELQNKDPLFVSKYNFLVDLLTKLGVENPEQEAINRLMPDRSDIDSILDELKNSLKKGRASE